MNIPTFDPTTLRAIDSYSMILVGMRRTGKTHAISCLLKQIGKQYDAVFLMSETCEVQDNCFEFIPDRHKFNGFKEDIVKRILDTQKKIKRYNQTHEEHEHKNIPDVLIILDDCINDHSIRHSKTLNDLFTMGRHFKVSIISLVQALTNAMNPKARNNADVMMFWRSINYKEREKIIENYLTPTRGKHSKQIGEAYMETIFDQPYVAMVVAVHAASNSKRLQDYVYRYLAPCKVPSYRLGNPKHFDDNDDRIGY